MTTEERKQESQAEKSEEDAYKGFIVGIGASAGGLEALESFFTNCPTDAGIAYVVVQHLSPDHKSMMLDLLSRYTKMEVVMVEDQMTIEANMVYLIPAGTIMRITPDHFELTPKVPHTLTLPIDIFFSSLAEAFGSKAIGIVLSGTGSDGTRGAMAINASGGFLLAQDTKSAKFDGMPSSVIGTGLVDAILPANELPDRVRSHIDNLPHTSISKEISSEVIALSDEDAYDGILQFLLQSSGIDFHDYKVATILRRIERRMQVRHMAKLSSYFELLQTERQELLTLKRELLIPVTNFFRDSQAFEALQEEVIDELVEQADGNNSIRVWVAGTSTGEEAYSIGILFQEAFERRRRWPNIKIFATDVSQESIDAASIGIFPEAVATEISEERLERFFIHSGNTYEVKPELRQMIVFAKHNLLSDPPFTQMDLVTCRNTLIYFTQDAQRKVLQRLQFAAKFGGYLFLGSSESIAGGDYGFVSVNAKQKLFKRNTKSTNYSFDTGQEAFNSYKSQTLRSRKHHSAAIPNDTISIDKATKSLVEQYAPASMLVNSHNEIIHLYGDIQPFFQVRDGSASLQINRVLPEKLLPVASALMYKALKDNGRMISDYIQIKNPAGQMMKIRLSVAVISKEEEESLLLLSFERYPTDESDPPEPVNVNAETMERVDVLERELAATRESLQATIEELETSNEELQATNEELMASNEELQSSNEELQSVNEELNTVNAEYQEKVNILNRVNADLDSMAKAVGVATVFVDNDLNLTRFSPDAVGLFKLRESDIGRPLDEINNNLKYDALMSDLESVLRTDRMIQKEIATTDKKLYLMRVLPYNFAADKGGVVATFVDITVFRERERLQAILDGLPEHIAVLENDGTIALVNNAWTKFARANGDPQLVRSGPGSNYLESCMSEDQIGEGAIRQAYYGVKAVLEGSKPAFTLQYPCHSPAEKRWFVMNVAPINLDEFAVVVSHINITTWFTDKRKEE